MFEFLGNVWASNIGGKLTLIFGAIILLGGIAGSIYGAVTGGGWKDNGLMKGPNGKPTRWRADDLPLTTWLSPTLHTTYIRALERVNDVIGEVIGRRPFNYLAAAGVDLEATKLLRTHVSVRDDEGMEPDHGNCTYVLTDDGYMKACAVQLPEAHVEGEKGFKIALHEMCHVLGLAHDESIASIRHPRIQQRHQELSDFDKKLLKKLYG